MITEDYVSFETAKLLKEKGFEGDISSYYHIWDNGRNVCSIQEFIHSEAPHLYIPAPTLQMAMKWFREVYHIGIFPTTYYRLTAEHEGHDYGCTLINLNTFEVIGTFVDCTFPANTYEETCEAAIKFCLEHLI